MMRNKPSSSMQKTYDDCYLICSTAIYFENMGNEAEALRSWRQALDQIYYHNAYRMPANYRPKSETEKALLDSLRQMEMQCKERVDLLEALRQSRNEAEKEKAEGSNGDRPASGPKTPSGKAEQERTIGLDQGTVPPVERPDLSRPLPPLPQRPSLTSKQSSGVEASRSQSYPQTNGGPELPTLTPSLSVTPSLSGQPKKASRSPSPEKRGSMLKTLRPGKDRGSSSRMVTTLRSRPPAAAGKAATLAFGSTLRFNGRAASTPSEGARTASFPLPAARDSFSRASADSSAHRDNAIRSPGTSTSIGGSRPESPAEVRASAGEESGDDSKRTASFEMIRSENPFEFRDSKATSKSMESLLRREPAIPPSKKPSTQTLPTRQKSPTRPKSPPQLPKLESDFMSYRKEYPAPPAIPKQLAAARAPPPPSITNDLNPSSPKPSPAIRRKQVPTLSSPRTERRTQPEKRNVSSESGDETLSSGLDTEPKRGRRPGKQKAEPVLANLPPTPTSQASDKEEPPDEQDAWQKRVSALLKKLPKGVDETAAKQILNEIVIHGDEVHWSDVAGLDIAKAALKETVVYPFLRPDLFMGLREPARGMLLFGPPGTGKTMLARAVATESKSTFFAISASSLTSKYLGESEKLVRALFALAKALAPSIIFVDEIDSLLSARAGAGEHEATRRIKTEFLIQWSDLQRAAAGRETGEKDKEKGDASRVLVLAATNLPWAIDEAARRRFVRRQYIPLPEAHVRRMQLETLLSHQKHAIGERELEQLVELTDGFSGSDITALAKDAAMGPLRSLGEKLLHMTMDEIRPIQFEDFQASLVTIRPSVSKQGLKEFEDWAKEFGERGG